MNTMRWGLFAQIGLQLKRRAFNWEKSQKLPSFLPHCMYMCLSFAICQNSQKVNRKWDKNGLVGGACEKQTFNPLIPSHNLALPKWLALVGIFIFIFSYFFFFFSSLIFFRKITNVSKLSRREMDNVSGHSSIGRIASSGWFGWRPSYHQTANGFISYMH